MTNGEKKPKQPQTEFESDDVEESSGAGYGNHAEEANEPEAGKPPAR